MREVIERIRHLVGAGRVKVIDDTGPVQTVQVDQGATGADGSRRIIDKVPRLLDFGFSSAPPIDSDIVVMRLAGNRTLTIAIASGHQPSRPKNLQPGDSMLYDVRGAHVKLTADGIEIDAAGQQVTVLNATKLRAECDIETTGDVISRADGTPVSLNDLRDAYHAHRHSGVASGGSITGPTDHDA